MQLSSFYFWLEHRLEEVPDATTLALVIARAGAAGVPVDRLRRALRLPPETLDDLLRALVATGQVVMLKVGGRTVYRAIG
jgi:hypothetical protein